MHVHLRRAGLVGAVALGTASAALLTALPASAVTTPVWETGRVPSSSPACLLTNLTSDGNGFASAWTDTTKPTITGWTVNGSTTTAVLTPGNGPITFTLRAKQSCGGMFDDAVMALSYTRVGGTNRTGIPLVASTTNAFDQVFVYSFSVSKADYAGKWLAPYAQVERRYDAFELDGTGGLSASTASTGAASWQNGPWSSQTVYLLLATKLTTSATKTTVAKGGNVTFRATLLKAGLVDYEAAVGSKVVLQTRVPGGSWVTRATKTADAAGKVSYTFAPGRTQYWRWVHVSERTSLFTQGRTGTTKTITVT